jgi:hypothetical protein
MDYSQHAHEDLGTLQRDVPSAQGVSSWGTHLAATRHMFNSDIRVVCTPTRHTNISNVVDHPLTIRMHRFPDLFHICGGDACGRSSISFIVFKGHSAAFEAPVPLETLRTTHCLITVSLLKHVQCLCDRFAQLNVKLLIGSFHLSVHNVIADFTRDHKNTNITTPDANTVMSLGTLPYQD